MLSDWAIAKHIRGVGESPLRGKSTGLVLQRDTLRHPDLLPLYGTSEVFFDSPYHAENISADAPTGFCNFAVGKPGALVFTSMESLGALGAHLPPAKKS